MTLTRTAALGVAVLALALGVAGCGGDDEGGGARKARGSTTTVTVTTSASASESASGYPTESAQTDDAGPPVDLTVAPSNYAEASAHVQAGEDVTAAGADELAAFVTPSGNIYCGLDQPGQSAACEISEGQVEDPLACPDNPLTQFVGRIELHGDRAVPICNTDTIIQPGAPTLDYGSAAYTRDTACVSEKIGVTCISRGAHVGFFLARGRFLRLGD